MDKRRVTITFTTDKSTVEINNYLEKHIANNKDYNNVDWTVKKV